MKILHLVESLERGGLERVVITLARAQRDAGNDVAVCCLFHQGQLAGELSSTGIRVTSANKTRGFDFRSIRHIRRELMQSGAAVLHTHNAVSNYYGALAVAGTPVRLFNTRHGMGFDQRPGRKERLYRVSLLRTTAVAMVCEAARIHYVAADVVPARLANVVRNGIDIGRFAADAASRRSTARRALGLSEDAFVVGTVGRLNWAKNHALLISGFALLAARLPSSRLLIVGDGELRTSLTKQIEQSGLSDRVLLVGDRDDVPDLLAAMDVFAMTSTTEGYSVALLEAAAASLPTIASDVGGNAEIVQAGVTGQLLASLTAASLADALEHLAGDAVMRLEMGRRARAWAEQQASIASMTRAYENLYSHPVGYSTPARVAL